MINVIVGETVKRLLSGLVEMDLKVTEVTEDRIHCGDWEFDRETGAEIDEQLGWGPEYTGSYIVKIE
jgi:hypothetical protein